MRRDEKSLFNLKLAEENKWLVGKVCYLKGGINYYSGNSNPRGYYLMVQAETISNGCRSFELFTGGLKALIEETPRFNLKRLGQVVPELNLLENVVNQLVKSKGLTFQNGGN